MNTLYAFDVDGTLTPSRQLIDPDFWDFLMDFTESHDCVLITGSDKDKTVEQLGPFLWDRFQYKLQAAGNAVYNRQGQLVHEQDIHLTQTVLEFIDSWITSSKCPVKTSNHVEKRLGMINISSIGRACTQEERSAYYEWDLVTKERLAFAEEFNSRFPELMAQVGGEISIDIFNKGKDKRQLRDWFPHNYIVFFGDKTEEGGNDYFAAQVADVVHPVRSWRDTWDKLKELSQ